MGTNGRRRNVRETVICCQYSSFRVNLYFFLCGFAAVTAGFAGFAAEKTIFLFGDWSAHSLGVVVYASRQSPSSSYPLRSALPCASQSLNCCIGCRFFLILTSSPCRPTSIFTENLVSPKHLPSPRQVIRHFCSQLRARSVNLKTLQRQYLKDSIPPVSSN